MSSAHQYKSLRTLPKDLQPSQAIYVDIGAYATVDLEKAYPVQPRMLCSSGFLNCIGVVACVKNSKGEPIRWGLAHIDSITNDAATATISLMDAELRRGDSSLPIEIDLVGGSNDKINSAFNESAKKAASELPNSTVTDLRFDDRLRQVAIDLKSGTKFSDKLNNRYTANDAAHEILLHAPENSRLNKQVQARLSNLSAPEDQRRPVVRFDWEDCMAEMKETWEERGKRILAKLRESLLNVPARR